MMIAHTPLPEQTRLGRILVVDDLASNLRLLHKILHQHGYQVQTAKSGADALTLIQEQPPELILLDLLMPGMNGYQVCQQVKDNPHTRDIPIIVLSAMDQILEKVRAFDMGAVDYITKPFHMAEIVARVQTHLTLRRLQNQLQLQNAQLQQEIHHRLATEAALQIANQELHRLAHLDGLTQVANRRCFDSRLEIEWRRLSREGQPIALILCDVDWFKRYNDHYGHQAGDRCLQQVATAIQQQLKRSTDLLARYGGEEFAVILPNTDLRGATHLAATIRDAVVQLNLPHLASPAASCVTVSVGVAIVTPSLALSPEDLIHAADCALYEAKSAGRNGYQIQVLDATTPPHPAGVHTPL